MENERVDTVEDFYKPVNTLDLITKVSFWISFVLSFVILIQQVFSDSFMEFIIISYLLIVIIHITLSFIVDYVMLPNAERERRNQLLTDSLNVVFSSEVTKNYYNNQYLPSIKRLGANIFENSLFCKEISKRMLNSERIKISLYILIWLTLLLIRKTDLQVIVIITQTLFSSELLFNWLRLEIFKKNVEAIYGDLFHLYSSKIEDNQTELASFIIKEMVAYESIKSLTHIKLSTRIFRRINSSIIRKWNNIRKELRMDKLE